MTFWWLRRARPIVLWQWRLGCRCARIEDNRQCPSLRGPLLRSFELAELSQDEGERAPLTITVMVLRWPKRSRDDTRYHRAVGRWCLKGSSDASSQAHFRVLLVVGERILPQAFSVSVSLCDVTTEHAYGCSFARPRPSARQCSGRPPTSSKMGMALRQPITRR